MNSLSARLCCAFIGAVLSGCGSGGGSSLGPSETSAFAPSAPAELLIEERFENGTFSPRWNNAYISEEIYAPGIDPFPSVSTHGPVMHYYIPPGLDDFTPIQLAVSGADGFSAITGRPEVEEFFIEWEEYFVPGHDFANGAQKMLRFTREPEEGVRRGTEVNFWLQVDNGNLQLFFYHPDGNNGREIDIFYNTDRGVPTGQWIRFAVWCRLNTPGQVDGFGRVFMDGQLFIDMSGISNRGTYSGGWNEMWLGGNHTNWGVTTRESSRYIDNVRWYSTIPAHYLP